MAKTRSRTAWSDLLDEGLADERLVRTTIAELAEQLARGGAASTAAVILFGALAGEYPS